MMDPETQQQFNEFDERMKVAEKQLLAMRNLVRNAGIPLLLDTQMKLDALIDSDARLYGRMEKVDERLERLAVAHEKTEQTMRELGQAQKELAESQKRTEESLRRFLDRTGNGHGS